MASFSNLSKTYAKHTLSKCATPVLLVCCYLYSERSHTINISAEAKDQGRDMQTPIDDSGILPRYREACKLPRSPRWSPSQGPSSRSDNSMDSLGPSPRASGSPTCLPASSPGCSPPSSLSSFWLKRRRPCSLRYTVAATPQTRLV